MSQRAPAPSDDAAAFVAYFPYQTTATALLFQGVDWRHDLRRRNRVVGRQGGCNPLASGAIANGGSQLFAPVVGGGNLQSVAAGDFLYSVVNPGLLADNSCDSTGLDVAIVAR